MNGFPLVILGVTLLALAYILWKIQGKIGEITGAVDRGFRAIEEGITKNLLAPGGAITGVQAAVDGSFRTIGLSISENMLGPGGIVPAATGALNNARDVFYQAGTEIQGARVLVAQDIRKVVTDSEVILFDVGKPLQDAGVTLNGIGNAIDVDILGTHPFRDLAQPFRDVGKTVDDVGDKCMEGRNKLMVVDRKLLDAAYRLDALTLGANNVGKEFNSLSVYTSTTFRNGVAASVNDLEKVRLSVGQLLGTFRTGVEASVKELEEARTFLDSELLRIVDRRMVMALAGAGAILIAIGVSLGI